MSFSGFGKTSGPSFPQSTQSTFENYPAFPWSPPNSNPNGLAASSVIPKVQQKQQLFLSHTQRPDASPNRLAGQRISPFHYDRHSQNIPEHESQSEETQPIGTFVPSKSAYLVASKRARSPLTSVDKPLHSASALLDPEREMQAKARRLARFHTEFTQSLHKSSGNIQNKVRLVQPKADEHADDKTDGGGLADHEGAELPKAVTGLCPDMCPELERDERERKGDLDKYERMNGDRNQTSQFLAVKKYNRMAEREAELIRPMPVLQKTVDYLLSLLDRPYDDNFLNIYNFLWDRMRAIRMDLRMQHIFNEDAIVMLEQMIRLHVISMHELCEFKKGEGFTEGFDAHLNIEQMNKTSVELFHLYDDQRKQGNFFASEKEFRGYYALFKLDKHPGYKVDPAELSLDLAKMTPEIRSTPEVLFARDVARACRIGNYIGFFRLARKATYLQACLMHAHFSKLRKQALASLHSSLQNNQGIPIAHVETWLAMEGEDVEGLLEYHGFSIKKYEEAYMVKEGPFLRSDMDFPIRCAQLVQQKRSKRIIDDARPALTFEQFPLDRECANDNEDLVDHLKSINAGMNPTAYDEPVMDSTVGSASVVLTEPSSLSQGRVPVIQHKKSGMRMAEIPVMMTSFMPPVENVGDHAQIEDGQQILDHDNEASFNETLVNVFESKTRQPTLHRSASSCIIYDSSTPKCENGKLETEIHLSLFDQKKTNKEMLKLILRKWKQQAAMRRENREHKQLIASAALSSLSLGLPICQIGYQQLQPSKILDVDAVARARHRNYGISWLRLNISDLVAPIMVAKNPDARCICWKLVLLVQPCDPANQIYQLASDWLFSKLMGASEEHEGELMVWSSGLSIWKKWSPQTCCLSIIQKKALDGTQNIDEGDVLDGASCLIFLMSETMRWETQRARLQNFCASIPEGSDLPLLILSTDSSREVEEQSLDIIRRLAFHNEEKRRICSSSVTFLAGSSCLGNAHGFFDDHQLRVGLQWLANNTPSMPSLCLVRTRELVLNYLRRYMAEKHKGLDVSPDDCVAGFNEALDKSAEDIMITASMNPTRWPAPEIDLLDKSSNEGMLASQWFPSTGWSSHTRIDALVRAIKSCKLPSFPDTSWLKNGSLVGDQIKKQKVALEKILISYLNESCKSLKADLAFREVGVMLQKCVGVQIHGSGCCLTPRWILIFSRIYSWKLNKLTVPGTSDAYILDSKYHLLSYDAIPEAYASLAFPSSSYLEDYRSVRSFPADVSLDELIEISCCNPFEKRPIISWATPLKTIGNARDGVEADGDAAAAAAGMISQNHDGLRCSSSYEIIPDLMNINMQISAFSKRDRLTTLLERCNKLQDTIDQKLAIYF